MHMGAAILSLMLILTKKKRKKKGALLVSFLKKKTFALKQQLKVARIQRRTQNRVKHIRSSVLRNQLTDFNWVLNTALGYMKKVDTAIVISF